MWFVAPPCLGWDTRTAWDAAELVGRWGVTRFKLRTLYPPQLSALGFKQESTPSAWEQGCKRQELTMAVAAMLASAAVDATDQCHQVDRIVEPGRRLAKER
mmetsp:Transcript_93148/g.179657  ORF Transcript_93148/g.179657 Transcript_93148/m.179657 type:complete len:101 (-) Transcript_93148:331-633(-)